MYPNVGAKVKGHSAPAGFEPLSRLYAILHYPYAITYLNLTVLVESKP